MDSAARFRSPVPRCGAFHFDPARKGIVTTILIVDDHPIFREGLRKLLEDELPSAKLSQASNAREALEAVRKQDWNLVILDINLPDKTGLEVLKEMKLVRQKVPVLILSLHSETQFAVRVFRSGAEGYLTKGSASDSLVTAVRRILAGGKYVSPSMAESLVTNLNTDVTKPLHEQLSDREYEVLRMLAQGKPVSAIAAELNLSVNTISTYRTRILEKMGLTSTAELILYAIRNRIID